MSGREAIKHIKSSLAEPAAEPDGKRCATHSPNLPPAVPLLDGRQSEAAATIARGTQRCLIAHGLPALAEVPLANGRRADLLGLGATGTIWIVEIKSSIADFRADQKWPEYRDYCDHLFFAVAPDFPIAILPDDAGHIIADRFGGEIVRPAPEHRLAPARRKALTTSVARLAAARLAGLADPDMRLESIFRE